jgi:hypothetical protein
MAANKATRRNSERAEQRSEEGSAARPLAREPDSEEPRAALEARKQEPEAARDFAGPSGETLAALERAAENIRPSWHGTELEAASLESGPAYASVPSPLPPPPVLPSFSSFPIEQHAPHYRVDSTVRTAVVLPERLAQLLNQPHLAHARSRALRQIAHASDWLRARPWAFSSLAAVALLLLAWLLWPSTPEAPKPLAATPKPASSAPASPAAPAPAPARSAVLPTPAPGSARVEAKPPEPTAPVAGAKKRDKRRAPAAKAPAAKTHKPAKTVAVPAR